MVKQPKIDIAGLKRQARAISKKSGLALHTCLDKVASENGYLNWALLQKGQTRAVSKASAGALPLASEVDAHQKILAALLSFFKSASANDVLRLSRGGSIWVDRNDARACNFTASSFVALGLAWDGLTKEAGMNLDAVLFADLDGIQENFVFPDDEDEEGKAAVPEDHQVHYTTETARKILYSEADVIVEGSVDALEEEVALRAE